MRQTAQGSHGLLQLVNPAVLRGKQCASFPDFARIQRERFPLRLTGDSPPRIAEGALCLNDPEQAQTVLATFLVTRRA